MKKRNIFLLSVITLTLLGCVEAAEAGLGLITFVLFLFKVVGIIILLIIVWGIIGSIFKK